MKSGLEITNLSLQVDGKVILDKISLAIPRGEIHALIGDNGSGKSSLLATIMGLTGYQITSGQIKFNRRLVNNLSIDERARLGIGLAFQQPPTFKGLTLAEVLDLADDLNVNLGVSHLASRPLNQGFSGGELRRSELWQLLHQQPDLALLDEPDSGVDRRSLGKIAAAIRQLTANRVGLVVTHNPEFLDLLAPTRIYRLSKGKLHETN